MPNMQSGRSSGSQGSSRSSSSSASSSRGHGAGGSSYYNLTGTTVPGNMPSFLPGASTHNANVSRGGGNSSK